VIGLFDLLQNTESCVKFTYLPGSAHEGGTLGSHGFQYEVLSRVMRQKLSDVSDELTDSIL
jgi:hypothetical protein